MNKTSGSLLPYSYDYKNDAGYASLSNFAKKKLDIIENADFVLQAGYRKSVYRAGLGSVRVTAPFEIILGSRDNGSRKTVDALIQETKNYYSTRMGKGLQDAGLI